MKNQTLIKAAQDILLKLLEECTEEQQALFKRMYAPKNLDGSINVIVGAMDVSKIDWAISQVEATIKKNESKEERMIIPRVDMDELEGWKLSGAYSNGGTVVYSKDKKYSIKYNGSNFIYVKDADPRLTEIQIEMAVLAYDRNRKGKVKPISVELYKGHPKSINELKEIIESLHI